MLNIYSHQNKKNKSGFVLLCSAVNLSKHNIYTLFGRLKQFFSCFITPYLKHHSVHLWNSPVFREQVKCCLFLNVMTCFEQIKEIMYQQWNMTLQADLIWTCGQHVLFHNSFGCFCLHLCVHRSKSK